MINAHWAVIVATVAALGIFLGVMGTGGTVLIPALVFVFGLTQIKAQGTALLSVRMLLQR